MTEREKSLFFYSSIVGLAGVAFFGAYRRPSSHEFSTATKQRALQRARGACEECGENNEPLVAHHRLGVWYAVNLYPQIPAWIISSIDNLEICCRSCHVELDNRMREEHYLHAIALLDLLETKR